MMKIIKTISKELVCVKPDSSGIMSERMISFLESFGEERILFRSNGSRSKIRMFKVTVKEKALFMLKFR